MAGDCPVCDGSRLVLVAIAHAAERRLVAELLRRDDDCWSVETLDDHGALLHVLSNEPPGLVVVDAADFPRCCQAAVAPFPPRRVVVIGPEPDAAYERAARHGGAGGWVARDRIADDLRAQMRCALGCPHEPGPPGSSPRPVTLRSTEPPPRS